MAAARGGGGAGAPVALAAAAALAACADVPASPTYVDDVRTILRASCVRCHAAPQPCTPLERRGYRLDHWTDVGGVRGVASMTERITLRAVDLGDMPLGGALPEREREILRRWQRSGSPRGEPAADEPPALALRSDVPAAEPPDQRVRLAYDVRDPDGDALSWSVGWERAGVRGELTGPLAGGRGEVAIDVGVLAGGTYQLVARLRDELAERPTDVALGGPIAIADRAAAPTVALDAPRGGEGLSRAVDSEIRWRADDVDSPGPLTATVSLRRDDGVVVELARDLDARDGRLTWSPSALEPGRYDVELAVTDGVAARSSRTPCPVTILP